MLMQDEPGAYQPAISVVEAFKSTHFHLRLSADLGEPIPLRYPHLLVPGCSPFAPCASETLRSCSIGCSKSFVVILTEIPERIISLSEEISQSQICKACLMEV